MKLYLIYQIKYIKIITANNKDKFAKYNFQNLHDSHIIYEFFFFKHRELDKTLQVWVNYLFASIIKVMCWSVYDIIKKIKDTTVKIKITLLHKINRELYINLNMVQSYMQVEQSVKLYHIFKYQFCSNIGNVNSY